MTTSNLSAESAEIITVEITDLSRGGAGVARDAGGRVIFVPFTAPGDRVKVRVYDAKKRYAQGELLEIVEPSPIRVQAPCPVFGRCGGCAWQHLPYELQWKTKVSGVRQALERVKLAPLSAVEEFPAERVWEYRNRIQLRGVSGVDGKLGFYAARSHELVPTDQCPISRPELNAAWEETRAEGNARFGARSADGQKTLRGQYKVEVEVLRDGSVRRTWNSAHGAAGFRQVHDDQNQKLRGWIAKVLTPGRDLYDLYGGTGNLSQSLAATMTRIDCVDLGAPRSRPSNTPANVHFHCMSTRAWLAQGRAHAPSEAARPRSAILDPPREGMDEAATDILVALEKLGVDEAVAVGCDADSWVRDLSRFSARGWRLERAAVLDFFPQTPHVESIALLRR